MMDIYPNTTIESLHQAKLLSVRSYNSLYYARLSTVGKILDYLESGNDLKNIHHLGRKSELEIYRVLQSCNSNSYDFRNDDPFALLNNSIKLIFCRSFEAVVCDGQNTSVHLSVRYPDVKSFFQSIMRGKDEILEIQQNLTKEENIAYRKWHIDVIGQILHQMEEERLIDDPLYQTLDTLLNKLKRSYMDFSISEIIAYFITDDTDRILQNTYDSLCIRYLNVRASNFKNNYLPSYRDVIPYFDKPLAEYSNICPGHGMRKTLLEIYGLVQKFKEEAFSSYEHYADPEVMHQQILKKDFPYLGGAQRDFVGSYIREYRIRPILYLLFNYIRISSKRECIFFSMYHGLFDGKSHSFDEIGQLHGISGERVRQIIIERNNILADICLTTDEKDHYKEIFNSAVLTPNSSEFKNVVAEEHLPNDFSIFCSLCSLILDYEICESLGYKVLFSRSLKNCLKFKTVIEIFNKTSKKNFVEDTLLPFSFFTGKTPVRYKQDIKHLLEYLSKDKRGVSVVDNGVIFDQNKINVEKELYKILYVAGKPLHLDEIFKAFKSAHPEHKFTSPKQIKSYLFRNQHIQAKGNQSVYGLDSWDNVYFGNIRRLLQDTLLGNSEPMHISDIYRVVKEHFPNTNIRSLMASMGSDSSNRFVQFEDGFFGLTNCQYPSSFVKSQGIPRFKFDQRIDSFRTFVNTYHRFPFFNGGDEEASLQRWLYNATHDNLDLSEDEMARLNATLNYYLNLGYPQTSTEYEFLINCTEYKRFISKNHKLPTSTIGAELYQWFIRSKENFQGYQDQRYDYFSELCDYILSYGFSIE